jgi:hypothetical protein
MQLAATAHAASSPGTAAGLLPREDIATRMNLSVQDLFNTLHVNARDAADSGGRGFRLTPATIVRSVDADKVTGNFLMLIQSARAVAPDAEPHLAAAEHAVSGLAQLLIAAAGDSTTTIDPAELGTQFMPPFNEQLALVSRAAQRVAAGSFA